MKLFLGLVLYIFLSGHVFAQPTPVMFSDFDSEIDLSQAIPWTKPSYENQEGVIGYNEKTFDVPPGMQERVSFWLDIYTKFSTDQGVLHDSLYVNLVYEVVDFSDIMNTSGLTDQQKRKARELRVKQGKLEIKERLLKLNKLNSPEGLEGDDLRYWQLFASITDKNKFREASPKGRLRFQLGQKDRFVKGIYHSGMYLPHIEQVFKDENLPKELSRLPFVESSFNYMARSKVGASGIWQFMRSTGRLYMKIDGSVDERNEPLKASESAAKLLRSNYKMLENWPIAVTAYNHGPSGMRRLMKKYNTDDLHEMIDVRRGRFGFASANFYASFLAALEAEKNADKYYGLVYRKVPFQYKKLVLNKSINKKTLLEWFSGDEELAKNYNPHLSRFFWKGYRMLQAKRYLILPPKVYDLAQSKLDSLPSQTLEIGEKESYKIGRGETLSQIAENFGVSLNNLKDINGIDNPRRIRAGQKIIIPTK